MSETTKVLKTDENNNLLQCNVEEMVIGRLTKFVESPLQKDEDLKKREDAIIELGRILSKAKRTGDLRQLIETTRPFLIALGKAKAARMVRDLVDFCLKIDNDGDIKVDIVQESIEWANSQKYVFLRQSLQARLIRLCNDLSRYSKALEISSQLTRELKKVDDKDLLLEVQLEESRACYYLSSLSKASAALTSARTIANAVYVTPVMQAGLDMQSGILCAADERDFQTAFSYFYEAFEGYDSVDHKQEATLALKYMLLCKVMLDKPDEINVLVSYKNAAKYQGDDISFILAIAKAAKNRSLKEFNDAYERYSKGSQPDPVVRKHFGTLSDTMLEKELCRLIEPYSYVRIAHIAKLINLSDEKVEKKLAQMILDKKFNGSLHQGEGMLIVYENVTENDNYELTVKTIRALGKAIDILYTKAQGIR